MPAHLKRKRPSRELEPSADPVNTANTAATSHSGPRRATRQTSASAPLPVPEPRRRRRRSENEANDEPTGNAPPAQLARSPRGKENIPVHSQQQQQQQQQPPPPQQRAQHAKPMTRSTRHGAIPDAPAAPRRADMNTQRAASATAPASFVQANPMALPDTQRVAVPPRVAPAVPDRPRSGQRPAAFDPFIHHQQSVSLGRNKPIIMATSTAPPHPAPVANANGTPNGPARAADNAGRPDRNIDKVVLGDICFRAWYPSYYGKEVLGAMAGGSSKGGGDAKGSSTHAATSHHHGSKDDSSEGRAHGRRERDGNTPMLDRLCVCPCCFKYSKELVTWWEHVRWCERQNAVPGRKIYTHPKGRRTVLVPSGPVPKQGRGKRSSVGQKMVEQVVQDEGEWSIWEVDGEKDILFCQNLSLFAKLFLDNKSVFFDVTGFNYFLLVYHPAARATGPQPRGQIVGFFSKEKISWDNNNLACILIFPPWQRKGLGSLLMGISYEISRREGLLGGPEKPISELGKRGYKRYWAGEIARWLLSLGPSSEAQEKGHPDAEEEEEEEDEIVVDIDRCSQATWIAPDDCLLVLREMGVAEDAGTGPPARPVQEPAALATSSAATPPTTSPTAALEESYANANAIGNESNDSSTNDAGATDPATAATATADQHNHQHQHQAAMVQRVRISQAAVRAWVAANRISLERACDPDGFVEGYAMKDAGPGVVDVADESV